MVKFSGGQWIKVAGRGNIYNCKVTQPDLTITQVHNQTVEIEGKEFFVSTVEIKGSDKLTKGSSIGLVVREQKKP